MMNALRNWSKRYFPSNAPQTIDQARKKDQDGRDRRTQSVSALQGEIRRIQHEISDLNDTMTSESNTVTSAQESQMASLHQQLSAKQRELGTYQARI